MDALHASLSPEIRRGHQGIAYLLGRTDGTVILAVSAFRLIAGITVYRFYFRLFPGTVRSPQVVEFLQALEATIGRRLLIIWDGLQAHRSRLVRNHVESRGGRIQLAFLPAYAPELNPTEYIWGYLKQHELPNFCAHDLTHLSEVARRGLKSMQRRPQLVRAFWKQAELPLDS